MATIIDREKLDTDPVGLLKQEIETSEKTCNPISRYGLAEKVAEQTGMPLEQAKLLVEAFCDEHAPATPGYLSNEFSLYWPKAIALLFGTLGLVALWFGRSAAQSKHMAWPWLVAGVVLLGIGVFQWVRSLEKYQSRSRAKRREREERLREKYRILR